jgi:adenosylhomocysteine nucleosidase
VLLAHLARADVTLYPFGEYFLWEYKMDDRFLHVVYAKIGWGKISSSAATQYVIDHWNPSCILNIGTCGGIGGRVIIGDVILASQTVIYDMHVEIGDPAFEEDFYTISLNTNWLGEALPQPVQRGMILTADSDLKPSEIVRLTNRYAGLAADWESGAIAFVSDRNNIACVILRCVTDLVSEPGGEVYGENQHIFELRVNDAIIKFENSLPDWLSLIDKKLDAWTKN